MDWIPNCDWKGAGVNSQDIRTAAGFTNIGVRGAEVTFCRPKFDSDGVTVQFEELSDISEDVVTCRLSRYRGESHVSSCQNSSVQRMDEISAPQLIDAIENNRKGGLLGQFSQQPG